MRNDIIRASLGLNRITRERSIASPDRAISEMTDWLVDFSALTGNDLALHFRLIYFLNTRLLSGLMVTGRTSRRTSRQTSICEKRASSSNRVRRRLPCRHRECGQFSKEILNVIKLWLVISNMLFWHRSSFTRRVVYRLFYFVSLAPSAC